MEDVRERVSALEPAMRQVDPWYEGLMQHFQDEIRRATTGKLVIRGDEEPWVQNRNACVKYYLHPFRTDSACDHMQVFIQRISRHNGMHRHQGGLVIYAVEGRGHTVYDDQRFDWEAGDLILLPIKPGGINHQHFNDDPERPVLWLALIALNFRRCLANEMVQLQNSPDWFGGMPAGAIGPPPDDAGGTRREMTGTPPPNGWDDTWLDRLFAMRDRYRQRARDGLSLIRGRSLDWETNRQGRMKWYMHPEKDDTALRSLVVFAQEIPPGSRSGRQVHPGGLVHFVLEGQGYSLINGTRHDWKAGDVIGFPFLPGGVEYQHFNSDPRLPVRFLAGMPNIHDALGPDLGSCFEQLEACPEYAGH